MKFLFIFLDGIGLGSDGPATNPFAQAHMPRLEDLIGGQALLAAAAPHESERATLLALDACLGVEGLPQSATGQATLLTGTNVPAGVGRHYGPKPNPEVAGYIRNGNLFAALREKGHSATLLNAYPPGYFEAIQSGRRLYAAIPLAVTSAGGLLRRPGSLGRLHGARLARAAGLPRSASFVSLPRRRASGVSRPAIRFRFL
ncbi:MAG: hypothetical protein P8Y14_19375 [Anaerolineales bacterium]